MNTAEQKLPELSLNEEDLLRNPDDWNKDMALLIANHLSIPRLTAEHWKVIDALRLHYERFGVAPAIHNICQVNHKSEYWVHSLFHTCFNAWRVAGLPDPGEEAKAYLNDM